MGGQKKSTQEQAERNRGKLTEKTVGSGKGNICSPEIVVDEATSNPRLTQLDLILKHQGDKLKHVELKDK